MMKWKSFGIGLVIHRMMFATDFELVDSIKQQQIEVH